MLAKKPCHCFEAVVIGESLAWQVNCIEVAVAAILAAIKNNCHATV